MRREDREVDGARLRIGRENRPPLNTRSIRAAPAPPCPRRRAAPKQPRAKPSPPRRWRIRSALLRPQAGKEGHGCGSGRLRQHRHGRGEKLLGVTHQRDRTADLRSKVSNDPVVDGHQRDTDHERQREAHPLAQSLVVPIENHAVACARAPGKNQFSRNGPRKAPATVPMASEETPMRLTSSTRPRWCRARRSTAPRPAR